MTALSVKRVLLIAAVILISACAPSSGPAAPANTTLPPTSQPVSPPTAVPATAVPATPAPMVELGADRTVITPATAKDLELVRTFAGHKKRVMALALSADGVHLASCGLDRTIKLWDVMSGQEVFSFDSLNQEINGIAFSPDGRLLATGVTIWDVQSKTVLHQLDRGEARKVAFSPDGTLLAVGAPGAPVKLWDVASGQAVRTFESLANNDTFTTVFSPDGTLVATSGYDGVIELWDVQSGQVARTLAYGYDFGIHSIAFSPDGSLLATVGEAPIVRLWEVATGRLVRSLPMKSELIAVAFSPDGTLLATGGYDNNAYLWSIPR